MRRTTDETGFGPPATRPLGRERRTVAVAELLATLGLAVGTLTAMMVITAGIARADVLAPAPGGHGGLLALAVVMGLLFAGMGGLTVMSLAPLRRRSDRD